MSRCKGLTSGTLNLRCYNAQVGEALANVKAMNKGKVSTLPLYLLIPTVSEHFCLFKNKLDSFLCRIWRILPAAQ